MVGTVVTVDGVAGMTDLKISGTTDELIDVKIGNLTDERIDERIVSSIAARIAGKTDRWTGGKTVGKIGSRIARTIAGLIPAVNCVDWTGPIASPGCMGGKGETMPAKSKWIGRTGRNGWKEWIGTNVWNDRTALIGQKDRIGRKGRTDQSDQGDTRFSTLVDI
jgi:hypothetical protein